MKFNDGLEKKVCLTDPKKKISRDNYKLFKKDRIKIFIFFIQWKTEIFDINLKIGYEMQIKVASNSSLFIIIYPYVFKI